MPLLNDITILHPSVDASGFVGMLDKYDNAARAYGLHLLSSLYSGPLVRVRKDAVGQPEKDFYPDAGTEDKELTLDSTDGSGTTLGDWIGSDDGYVVTWYDQSGNGEDATQGTTSTQPKIVDAGVLVTEGGKAAMAMDNDWLTFTSYSSADTTTLAVVTCDLPGQNTGTYAGQIAALSNWYQIAATLHSIRVGGTAVTFASSSNSGTQIHSVFKNATDAETFKNGSSLGTTSTWSGFNLTLDTIGAIFSGARVLDGKVQCFIIWDEDKISEQASIHSDVNDFYGTY